MYPDRHPKSQFAQSFTFLQSTASLDRSDHFAFLKFTSEKRSMPTAKPLWSPARCLAISVRSSALDKSRFFLGSTYSIPNLRALHMRSLHQAQNGLQGIHAALHHFSISSWKFCSAFSSLQSLTMRLAATRKTVRPRTKGREEDLATRKTIRGESSQLADAFHMLKNRSCSHSLDNIQLHSSVQSRSGCSSHENSSTSL